MVKIAMPGSIGDKGDSTSRATTERSNIIIGTSLEVDYSAGFALPLTIHTKLNGINYLEWLQSIKLVVKGRAKFGYLTDCIKEHVETDPNF